MLKARNIFYAPDYAINAGGLIHVSDESVGYDRSADAQRFTMTESGLVVISKGMKLHASLDSSG